MNKICPTYGIQMGTVLGQIFCTFHKDGCILGRNFLYISVKWVHFSGKNVCTLSRKFVPEPSITSKIHREPPPRAPPKCSLAYSHVTSSNSCRMIWQPHAYIHHLPDSTSDNHTHIYTTFLILPHTTLQPYSNITNKQKTSHIPCSIDHL